MLCLVSILSEQPVPNLFIIKQFGEPGIQHIFLSTEKIEVSGISLHLKTAAGIEEDNVKIRLIDPADPAKISEQLESFGFDKQLNYIVNVTGGTKMMSQSVTAHFMKEYPSCRIVYLDINSGNLSEIHPRPGISKLNVHKPLTLGDYFAVHGFKWTHQQHRHKSPNQTIELMKQVIRKGGLPGMKKLQPPYDQHEDLNARAYFAGGWFEEWSWHMIKTTLKLSDKDIMHGVKLYKHGSRKSDSDHELDVAFVYKGRLYVAECKAFSKYEGEKFNKTAFKLAGISRNLGYACKSMICLCVKIPENAFPHIEDLTRAIRVNGVMSLNEMSSVESFREALDEIVK